MESQLARANRFFDLPLGLGSRALVLAATLLFLPPAYLLPLWRMDMYSNQYPDGLHLYIHAHKLDAGNRGNDLREINTLNHYIGMKALDYQDFAEFKWLPFLIGFFIIFGLRAVVIGRMVQLVDLLVMFTYFGLFSLWSFGYKLYLYGHNLEPTAAVKVEPFTPPLLGRQTLANFEVSSTPGLASYLLGAFPLMLILAVLLSYRKVPREPALPA